ncbi:hypothetical protein BT67DRAFT_208994 [Trichocladium antarcticum]|uniref:Protein kinase domain-containing protein n=1 Tax=Trichocladium antarcticum TaxID=1450529 RepID=A0AAN6UD04_9PEZI|nr:hypothetical protein BT67DRAFT_208994 [Trichocladium antarcticum]
MAQNHAETSVGASALMTDTNSQTQQSLWRRLFSSREKDNGTSGPSNPPHKGHGDAEQQDETTNGHIRRVSRTVVPGLPRTQTFKRQRSEVRSRLQPVRPTPAERRAVSMDRRTQRPSSALAHADPRTSAPDFLSHPLSAAPSPPSLPTSPFGGMMDSFGDLDRFELDTDSVADGVSRVDVRAMTNSQYDALIHGELERIWILNLSMHFRDRSRREKFFVTYRQHDHLWRRVTVSLDYRNAPENSLESALAEMTYQRDKSAKIYEAIRDSLPNIAFYDSVTNLKLETKEGRLHVHVVEDVNEIINYPPVRMIQHMSCRRVKEREIHFDSHMSGFVYKVRVHGRVLIKKEIPGPDNVDEFLYEINALDQLAHAENVIRFYGVVVDDREQNVTGLLISYASRGALLDVIYDNDHSLSWPNRAKWARQIVAGLSEIHEAGFVQGDFTLSNIVIDEIGDAKIIDINRRGCPIGWEPPEATPLIDSNQRISMYIGVKSDLYQLGMVLWALAAQDDEPENFGRPLRLGPDIHVPRWYRRIVETCLSTEPRNRTQALQLLSWFPDLEDGSQHGPPNEYFASFHGDSNSRLDHPPETYAATGRPPQIKTARSPSDWAYVGWSKPPVSSAMSEEPYYPTRGRSPPSPMPSNQGDFDSSRYGRRMYTWSDTYNNTRTVPSVSDIPPAGLGRESDAYLRERSDSLGQYSDTPGWSRRTGPNRDDDSLSDSSQSETRGRAAHGAIGLPPRQTARHQQQPRSAERPTPSRDRGIRSPVGPHGKRRERAGPRSHADSGKDLTDMASTPRERRGSDIAVLPPGAEGRASSTADGSSRRNGQGFHRRGRGPDEHDGRLLASCSGCFGQPDDLKGVGLALAAPDGAGGEGVRREIMLDDDEEEEEEEREEGLGLGLGLCGLGQQPFAASPGGGGAGRMEGVSADGGLLVG